MVEVVGREEAVSHTHLLNGERRDIRFDRLRCLFEESNSCFDVGHDKRGSARDDSEPVLDQWVIIVEFWIDIGVWWGGVVVIQVFYVRARYVVDDKIVNNVVLIPADIVDGASPSI